MAALPTTNLTLHLDASVNTWLWNNYQSGTPFHNSPPVHNDDCQVWDDADGKDLSMVFMDAAIPRWQQTTPLMATPCLDFNLSYLALWNHAATVQKPLSAVIGGAAFMVFAAIRIEGGTSNDSAPSANDAIVADGITSGGYWGIHVKNNAGAYSLVFYVWDGSAKVVTLSVALNTNYVIAFWHTGTAIFAEVYTTAGLLISGNTTSVGAVSDLTHQLTVGRDTLAANRYDGRLAELAIYNAYNATDKTIAVTALRNVHVPSGGGGPSAPTLVTLTPNSAYVNATVPVKLVGVAFTGTGLDGASGAFDPVTGFTFSNLSIVSGGLSGTVDIQIVAAKATGVYNFTYTTAGGASVGTSSPQTFTILSPTGGTAGDTGSVSQFNVGFN